MRLLTALAGIFLLAAPALAAETAWVELAPGVRARMIASEVRHSDGTTIVGLEVEMPQGTKTYWRIPGEAGIPTEIEISGSIGVNGATILWPYPTLDTTDGYTEYVYYGHTVLPVQLEIEGDAPVLDAEVIMGICSDVCVPAMAHFELPLDFAKADAAQNIRLGQALAQTPMAWEERHDAITSVTWDSAANGLSVTLGDPEVDWSSLIADLGDAGHLFGAPQKSPDGHTILLPLLGSSDPAGLLGKPVQLTFQTPMGPFEQSRRIPPAAVAAKH